MGSQTGTDSDGSRASDEKERGARGREKGTRGTRARRGASSEPNDSSGTRETSGASGMNQKKSRVGKGATPTAVQSAGTAFGQNTVAAALTL